MIFGGIATNLSSMLEVNRTILLASMDTIPGRSQIMKKDATKLRNGKWAIRPVGYLGTCGWINGVPWTVKYVNKKPANIPERR